MADDAGKPSTRGESHRWTDEQVDAMSRVGPDDIEEADDDWKAKAPGRFAGLIDAEEAGPEDEDEDDDATDG